MPFDSRSIRQMATEIARDEHGHVEFFRSALGSAAVARPAINIRQSFSDAATAAGLINAGETFDVYASEDNFPRGAFLFEDVGVTGFKGAAPLSSNKTYLDAAAGILAVEAYHAANIRTELYERGGAEDANAISSGRASLNPGANVDQGLTLDGEANIVPDDRNGIAWNSRPGNLWRVLPERPQRRAENQRPASWLRRDWAASVRRPLVSGGHPVVVTNRGVLRYQRRHRATGSPRRGP